MDTGKRTLLPRVRTKKIFNSYAYLSIKLLVFLYRVLTTLNSERGKGYGDLITKIFCKEFVERENLDLITFIADTNYASLKLFEKIKFRNIADDDKRWILLKLKRSEHC